MPRVAFGRTETAIYWLLHTRCVCGIRVIASIVCNGDFAKDFCRSPAAAVGSGNSESPVVRTQDTLEPLEDILRLLKLLYAIACNPDEIDDGGAVHCGSLCRLLNCVFAL